MLEYVMVQAISLSCSKAIDLCVLLRDAEIIEAIPYFCLK